MFRRCRPLGPEVTITNHKSQVHPNSPGYCNQCFLGGSVGTSQRLKLESEAVSAGLGNEQDTLF